MEFITRCCSSSKNEININEFRRRLSRPNEVIIFKAYYFVVILWLIRFWRICSTIAIVPLDALTHSACRIHRDEMIPVVYFALLETLAGISPSAGQYDIVKLG